MTQRTKSPRHSHQEWGTRRKILQIFTGLRVGQTNGKYSNSVREILNLGGKEGRKTQK